MEQLGAKERSKAVGKVEAVSLLLYNRPVYNTGLRPKELLGLYIHEISAIETEDAEIKKTHLNVLVLANNSKTGRSRVLVASIKNHISRIKQVYKELGVEDIAQDFLLFNPGSQKPWLTPGKLSTNDFRKSLRNQASKMS